jgi:hypothetical protein
VRRDHNAVIFITVLKGGKNHLAENATFWAQNLHFWAFVHVRKSGFLIFRKLVPSVLGHAIKLGVVPFFKLGKDPTS